MGRKSNKSKGKLPSSTDKQLSALVMGDGCDECQDKAKLMCPKCHSLFCKKCLKKNKGVCYSCDYKIL